MAKLAELVDHVIGVDPDRDRITAAVVCAKTPGRARVTDVRDNCARLRAGAAMGQRAHGRRTASLGDRVDGKLWGRVGCLARGEV